MWEERWLFSSNGNWSKEVTTLELVLVLSLLTDDGDSSAWAGVKGWEE